MNSTTSDPAFYDVVVIGGSLSGASTATLLLRQNPGLKLLIVERSTQFTRRVGEATVEVSAFFLGRVLGLTQYLNESHLVKQGMRFWFQNDKVNSIDDASEIGGRYQVRLPAYQLDRATFDEEVLRRACLAGATCWRPATVTNVQLSSGGEQLLTLQRGDATQTVRARWIVDASGFAAFLARKNGWWRPNPKHPIAAAWSRWKGVKDWDGRDLAEKHPDFASAVHCIRGTATNHVVGDGWWSWWIPLKGGDVSVGVVFDQRLVEWPTDGGNIGARLKAFLMKHPVGREMLADAEWDEKDMHWRRDLACYSTTFAGDGFVIVGDASAFIDPFYSPGMDWVAFTASAAAELISAQRRGEPVAERVTRQNRDFVLSHRSWFEAVYQDKYEYLGEWDLMRIAFRLDLGLYYLGIVSQPFKSGPRALLDPPFASPLSRPVFHLMKTYNRRFAQMAHRRRQVHALGRTNCGRRCLLPGFTLSRGDVVRLLGAFADWGWLEVTEGWRTWWRRPKDAIAENPVRLTAPAPPSTD